MAASLLARNSSRSASPETCNQTLDWQPESSASSRISSGARGSSLRPRSMMYWYRSSQSSNSENSSMISSCTSSMVISLFTFPKAFDSSLAVGSAFPCLDAPPGAVRRIFQLNPHGVQLVAQPVGLGEIALLSRLGPPGDQLIDVVRIEAGVGLALFRPLGRLLQQSPQFPRQASALTGVFALTEFTRQGIQRCKRRRRVDVVVERIDNCRGRLGCLLNRMVFEHAI